MLFWQVFDMSDTKLGVMSVLVILTYMRVLLCGWQQCSVRAAGKTSNATIYSKVNFHEEGERARKQTHRSDHAERRKSSWRSTIFVVSMFANTSNNSNIKNKSNKQVSKQADLSNNKANK